MLDLKRIRTDFDSVAEKLATRGVDAAILNQMKTIDKERRDLLVKVEELKAERNTVSAEIAQAKRNKENADDKIAAMQKLSAEVKNLDATLSEQTRTKMSKFVAGGHRANLTLKPRLTGIWVKIWTSWTGSVGQKLLVLASSSIRAWEQDLSVLSTILCWMSMAKKAIQKSSLPIW